MITCKDCWWFIKDPKSLNKGQCLAYGLTVKNTDLICCEFERGKKQ